MKHCNSTLKTKTDVYRIKNTYIRIQCLQIQFYTLYIKTQQYQNSIKTLRTSNTQKAFLYYSLQGWFDYIVSAPAYKSFFRCKSNEVKKHLYFDFSLKKNQNTSIYASYLSLPVWPSLIWFVLVLHLFPTPLVLLLTLLFLFLFSLQPVWTACKQTSLTLSPNSLSAMSIKYVYPCTYVGICVCVHTHVPE